MRRPGQLTTSRAERKIAGPMLQQPLRSSLIVAGLLLLGVSLGDTIAGRAKVVQYEELLRTTEATPPADPAALFPTASESRERHDLARMKLGFYHLLLTAGQVLIALGA